MKAALRILTVLLAAATLTSIQCRAQWCGTHTTATAIGTHSPGMFASLKGMAQPNQCGKFIWDTDIRQLRNNFATKPIYEFENWLQYSPALILLITKATGYEGRSSWGRLIASTAFSVALYAGLNNALKYSIKRPRPDGSANNSMPSGHTGTAFMLATMLHKEYGWRSPWWSFGGYALATVTALARIGNNRHWMTDTFAGAALGIGCTELGYFIADKIFKDKYYKKGYVKPEFEYDSDCKKYYSLHLYFGRRFIVNSSKVTDASLLPYRGGSMGLEAQIPVVPQTGFCARIGAGSLTQRNSLSYNIYNGLVGAYWNASFAKILEIEFRLMLGYGGYASGDLRSGSEALVLGAIEKPRGGLDVVAGASFNIITGNNFKLRGMAEWETVAFTTSRTSYLNGIVLGCSAGFWW